MSRSNKIGIGLTLYLKKKKGKGLKIVKTTLPQSTITTTPEKILIYVVLVCIPGIHCIYVSRYNNNVE